MSKLNNILLLITLNTVIAIPFTRKIDPRIDVNADWRIIGGSNAPQGGYPFVVSLQSSAGIHFCGGTILNSLWVLTSAQCIVGRTTSTTFILVGTNTLNYGGLIYNANGLLINTDYNPITFANDVGVVKLHNQLIWSDFIQPIVLLTSSVGSVPALVMGWGRTSMAGGIPNNLQQLATNTLTAQRCEEIWGSVVDANNICAINQAGQGLCYGDSGGPLIQSGDRPQIGIASSIRVAECALGYPDVYLRVHPFIGWIFSAITT